mmetsp:Transcript_25521/g.58931  ORF Transcript_25521/g.58931 Transcript_25521/m.58931 type:complete len:588 (-) Transcript_25521:51-1814(-)
MGASNSAPEPVILTPPRRLLEVCVARPAVPRPKGPDGQLLEYFALARLIGEPGSEHRLDWGQAVQIPCVSDTPRIKLQVLAALSYEAIAQGSAFHVSEVCIPYAGSASLEELGLRPNGPQVDMRLALVHGSKIEEMSFAEQIKDFVRAKRGMPPDAWQVAVTIREYAVEARQPHSVPSTSATASSPQAPRLNASATSAPPSGASMPRQLQSPRLVSLEDILRDSDEQQRRCESIRQQVERMKASATEAARAAQGVEASKGTAELLEVLAQAKEGQMQIKQTFEERMRDLQEQLRLAREEGSQGPSVTSDEILAKQRRLELEADRRDQLMKQWREAVAEKQQMDKGEDHATLLSDVEVANLQEKSMQYQAELEELQQELNEQSERESRLAAKNTMSQEAEAMREQLEELQQLAEDERVRSEYEVRELRKDLDTAEDKKAEAIQQRECSLARKSTLEGYQDGPNRLGSTYEELDQLRAEHERQGEELERLQKLGEARKIEIAALEDDQKRQIEEAKSSLLTPSEADLSGSMLGTSMSLDDPQTEMLETEVAALESLIGTAQETNQALEAETSRLRMEINGIQAARRNVR